MRIGGMRADKMLREAKKSEKNIIESRNNFPTLAAASASHLYSLSFLYLQQPTLLFFYGWKIFPSFHSFSNNRYAREFIRED